MKRILILTAFVFFGGIVLTQEINRSFDSSYTKKDIKKKPPVPPSPPAPPAPPAAPVVSELPPPTPPVPPPPPPAPADED